MPFPALAPALHPAPLLAGLALLSQSPSAASPRPVATGTDDGLTLAEVIQSLPVDPASIVTFLLLLAFMVGVVWFGTRSRPSGASSGSDAAGGSPKPQ
jgi:hypothetical protein